MNGTWNCFSIFRVFIWSPIYSHYHNWFSLVFWLFETSLELRKVSYSLHDSEMVIRTWPRMFCTLNTYINWYWICRSIWRETCMSPMISGTSLFCIAVMKSWLGSLTLYSTCITNGARLFAAVSPIGTLALLSWEWNITSAGSRNPAPFSKCWIIERANIAPTLLLPLEFSEQRSFTRVVFACLFPSIGRTFRGISRKLRNMKYQGLCYKDLQ